MVAMVLLQSIAVMLIVLTLWKLDRDITALDDHLSDVGTQLGLPPPFRAVCTYCSPNVVDRLQAIQNAIDELRQRP